MTHGHPVAAPPDEGHQGSYTIPEETLLAAPSDTRASESLKEREFTDRNVNRGLMQFWLVVALGVGLLVVVGMLAR
jgi:hypothetical protein